MNIDWFWSFKRPRGPDLAPNPVKQAFFKRKKSIFEGPRKFDFLYAFFFEDIISLGNFFEDIFSLGNFFEDIFSLGIFF